MWVGGSGRGLWVSGGGRIAGVSGFGWWNVLVPCRGCCGEGGVALRGCLCLVLEELDCLCGGLVQEEAFLGVAAGVVLWVGAGLFVDEAVGNVGGVFCEGQLVW